MARVKNASAVEASNKGADENGTQARSAAPSVADIIRRADAKELPCESAIGTLLDVLFATGADDLRRGSCADPSFGY